MAFSPIERNAKRLRIYIGDSDQWRGKPLYAALLEQLKKEGMAGATVVRGVASFGAHSRIHTASILSLSTDLPLIIEVIDSPEKIQQAIESISPMVREGLITLEDIEVLAYTHRFLHPLPADKQVRQVMTKDPVTIRSDQPLIEAWKKMLEQNIKGLPVIDAQDHVVGVLTHDDLLERAGLNARLSVAQQLDEESLQAEMEILCQSGKQVADVMSYPAIAIHPEDPIALAAGRLLQRDITRLPVVDEQGKLVGMVSRLDVLRQVLDIPEKEQKQMEMDGKIAGQVLLKRAPLVHADADLTAVIASFLDSGEHRVIVVNDAGEPIGLISDSDVVGRIGPAHRKGILGAMRGLVTATPVDITAREIMSPGVETITADTPVVGIIRRMVTTQRKWLVVVDEAGKPIGLIDREIALESLIR